MTTQISSVTLPPPPLGVSVSDLFSVLLKHSLVEYRYISLCYNRLQKFNFFSKAAYQVRDMHDKVPFSDLDIPVTHISYTDSDMTGLVLVLK